MCMITSIAEAIAQLNENLVWETSYVKATLALESVRYLIANRAQAMSNGGSQLSYDSLLNMEQRMSSFVQASAPSASASRTSFTRGIPLR